MAQKMTGGCHCGAVRYEISTDPLFSGNCYCEDCRKVSGTGHASVLAVPEPAFSAKGTLTEYQSPGGSGQPVTRRFCPICGSRIQAFAEAGADVLFAPELPDLAAVNAVCSSVDRPSANRSTHR